MNIFEPNGKKKTLRNKKKTALENYRSKKDEKEKAIDDLVKSKKLDPKKDPRSAQMSPAQYEQRKGKDFETLQEVAKSKTVEFEKADKATEAAFYEERRLTNEAMRLRTEYEKTLDYKINSLPEKIEEGIISAAVFVDSKLTDLLYYETAKTKNGQTLYFKTKKEYEKYLDDERKKKEREWTEKLWSYGISSR